MVYPLKTVLLKPLRSWKNKYLKKKYKKLSQTENFREMIAKEIGEYSGVPHEDVKSKSQTGPVNDKDYNIFYDQGNLKQQAVEEYYKTAEHYLYELPLWNAETNRPKYLCHIIVPYLRRFGCNKVVDFGGGAGDLCIELKNNNLDVSYCDISERLFPLAQWRFQRRNMDISMYKGIDKLQPSAFDCLISFDVFEHLKDLPQMVGQMAACIKPGGLLIFSGAFSGGMLHLEENDRYDDDRVLDDMLRSKSLKMIDKFAQYFIYQKNT